MSAPVQRVAAARARPRGSTRRAARAALPLSSSAGRRRRISRRPTRAVPRRLARRRRASGRRAAGCAGRPQRGVARRAPRARTGALAARRRPCTGAERERRSLAAAAQRARRARSSRAAPWLRTRAATSTIARAVVAQPRAHASARRSRCAPTGRIVTSRLMPPKLNHERCQPVALHRRRVALVGAHDERVRAPRRQRRRAPRTAGRRRCARAACWPSTHTVARWWTDSKRIA